jgi:hypothetical protein
MKRRYHDDGLILLEYAAQVERERCGVCLWLGAFGALTLMVAHMAGVGL